MEDKSVNFTLDYWNPGYEMMIKQCILHVISGNLLLLKDLLEL